MSGAVEKEYAVTQSESAMLKDMALFFTTKTVDTSFQV